MFVLKYDVAENGPVKKNVINPLRTNVARAPGFIQRP